VTLPEDVVRWLKSIHPDPAWAIVTLFERSARRRYPRQPQTKPPVELAEISARRALIVVDPRSFRSVPGASVIPVAAGRAFLAFDHGRGLADLELAIRDRLDDPATRPGQRNELAALHRHLREWRRLGRFRLSTRSIILVEHNSEPGRRRSR